MRLQNTLRDVQQDNTSKTSFTLQSDRVNFLFFPRQKKTCTTERVQFHSKRLPLNYYYHCTVTALELLLDCPNRNWTRLTYYVTFFFLNEKHSYVFDSDLVSHQNIVLRIGAPSVTSMNSLNLDKIKSLSAFFGKTADS